MLLMSFYSMECTLAIRVVTTHVKTEVFARNHTRLKDTSVFVRQGSLENPVKVLENLVIQVGDTT